MGDIVISMSAPLSLIMLFLKQNSTFRIFYTSQKYVSWVVKWWPFILWVSWHFCFPCSSSTPCVWLGQIEGEGSELPYTAFCLRNMDMRGLICYHCITGLLNTPTPAHQINTTQRQTGVTMTSYVHLSGCRLRRLWIYVQYASRTVFILLFLSEAT